MKNSVFAVLAVAGLATAANAQATFDLLTQWGQNASPGSGTVASIGLSPVIDITGNAPGQYRFTLQGGMFNFSGNGQQLPTGDAAANRGIQSILGSVALGGGGATLSFPAGSPRISPFGFGPGVPLNGTIAGGGTQINNFDANFTQQTVFWPWANPTRPPAGTRGVNSYANVYSFIVNVADATTPRDITIDIVGQFGEGALGWGVISENFPDVDGEVDGNVTYGVLASGFRPVASPGTLTLRIVPAPGAAALLGLGGLVAARRRRA